MSKTKKQNEHQQESEVDTFEHDAVDNKGEKRDEKSEQEISLEQQLEEKENERIALERELSDVREKMLRKAAEFENMKKRTERERIQVFEAARMEALKEFLPINDDLKRTLEAADSSSVDDTFLDGVKMIAAKFDEVLSKYGVERIDEVNVPFDVELHDAMMKQKADSEVEPNTVLAVLEPGYKMNDRVIRHAKVIVSE